MKREEGFTLVELMVVMALTAILLTLSVSALRNFWWRRSLDGGAEQMVTQLRELQERVVAETHPLVYGARFVPGDETWGLVRYDPDADTCEQYQTIELDSGVYIQSASFADDPVVTGFCEGKLPGTNNRFVFFFARGNATEGTVTIRHDGLDSEQTVQVAGITGRTERP